MTVQVLQPQLNAVLGQAVCVIPKRTTLDVLTRLYLHAQDSALLIAATDLTTYYTRRLAVGMDDGETTWGALVDAQTFADLVKTLPDTALTLGLTATGRLHLVDTVTEAHFPIMPETEFPQPPDPLTGAPLATLSAADLVTALRHVVFAAATDETHPVLTGVRGAFQADTLTLDAADGFRLARYTLALPAPAADATALLIPATSLAALLPMLEAAGGNVEIRNAETRVIFRFAETVISVNLLDGPYPDIGRVIPLDSDTRITTATAPLLAAIKRATVFAREADQGVDFRVDPGQMLPLTVAGLTGGHTGMTELPATVDGPAGEWTCNHRFLTDVLTVLKDAPEVTLSFRSPTQPFTVTASADPAFRYVVMPMYRGNRNGR